MKKKLMLMVACSLTPLLTCCISAFGYTNNNFLKFANAAATDKTMTFDSSHTSVTTSAGNTFSSYWISKVNASGFNKSGALAYLEGKATWNSYTESYTQSNPSFGIKGEYKISNVSKLEISYKVDTSWTDCSLYTLNSDGSLGGSWSICSTYTSSNTVETTKTINISNVTSYYGFAFKVTHPSNGGGSNDTMRVWIKSFKIYYSC